MAEKSQLQYNFTCFSIFWKNFCLFFLWMAWEIWWSNDGPYWKIPIN